MEKKIENLYNIKDLIKDNNILEQIVVKSL